MNLFGWTSKYFGTFLLRVFHPHAEFNGIWEFPWIHCLTVSLLFYRIIRIPQQYSRSGVKWIFPFFHSYSKWEIHHRVENQKKTALTWKIIILINFHYDMLNTRKLWINFIYSMSTLRHFQLFRLGWWGKCQSIQMSRSRNSCKMQTICWRWKRREFSLYSIPIQLQRLIV